MEYGTNKIILGDCVSILQMLRSSSVDLIVTSPPYKDEDGYSQPLMHGCARACWNVLAPNSCCFVNFGHLAGFKDRPFDVVSEFIDVGFTLNDTIVWVKNHYRPIQGKRRLNNLSEFIFFFTKGNPEIDRLAIGVPYADKSNVGRFSDQDLKCRGNVWEIPYDTIQSADQKLHNDRFPVALPELCIKLASKPGDVVLDPFMGSGTTAVAAVRNDRRYIGVELSENHWKTATERLDHE